MTATAPPGSRAAPPPDPEERAGSGDEMTIVEHLEELRGRLFKSAIAIVVGLGIGFLLFQPVLDLMMRPYCDLPPDLRGASRIFDVDQCELVVLRPLDGLAIMFRTAAITAVVIAAPVVCYQIWRFVTPGLEPVERRYAIPFVVLSQVLFAAGAVFSWFVIPRALEFLLGLLGSGFVPVLNAADYLRFVLATMIAFGASFEFPLVLIALSLTGVLSAGQLKRARRYAIVGVFAAAAVITPTQDPITMSMMAGPLLLFYEISVLAAWLIERRRRRTTALETTASA